MYVAQAQERILPGNKLLTITKNAFEIITSSYNVPNFSRDSLLHQCKRKNLSTIFYVINNMAYNVYFLPHLHDAMTSWPHDVKMSCTRWLQNTLDVDSEGTNQPTHPHSLTGASVVCLLNHWINPYQNFPLCCWLICIFIVALRYPFKCLCSSTFTVSTENKAKQL